MQKITRVVKKAIANMAKKSAVMEANTASIVLVNKTTGAKVTLRAWCDIYGDTDEY